MVRLPRPHPSFGALHFWHSVLLAYDLWSHENEMVKVTNLAMILLLLVIVPCVLIFLAVLCIVLYALNSRGAKRQHARTDDRKRGLLDADLVHRHVRCITVILLLAPMDIELMGLLPWTSQAYGGFPSRRVLMSFMLSALVQKISLMVVGASFIALE